MTIAIVVIVAVLTVATVIYVVRGRSPEQTAGHEAVDADPEFPTMSERLYDRSDRPAGPDAETQSPEERAP